MRAALVLLLLSPVAGDQKTEEILMVSAAVADIVTTEIGLAHGTEEANPLLRHQGARIAAKVGVTAGLIVAARKLEAGGHPKMALWLRWMPIVFWSSAAGWNVSMTVGR